MTTPRLSDAQRRAVTCEFTDALVNAGAGSGKTRVLSERFVHLVRTGAVDLRALAALTFTEKAAAQMRQRIAALFRTLQGEADAETAADLARWRADVEFAPISTIHAFCALLLRQHAIEAGVDPAFTVLDALEADLIELDAAEQAEQVLARDEPELVQVLATVGGDSRDHVLSLLRRLRGAGRAIDDLVWQHGEGDVGSALAEVEAVWPELVAGRDCLEEARHEAFDEAIERVQAVVAQVRADPDTSPFPAAQAQAAIAQLTGPRKHAYSKPRKALDLALGELTAALLDRWGERVLLPGLKRALHAYATTYERLKDEQDALDFTDLELRARDLLRDAHAVDQPLDLAPHGLLVDEYQDTNPLQAELLGSLRTTGAGVPQFAVGDPKQGIYRFRRADVGVILREEAHVGPAHVFPMHASYRSCPPLVAAVNALQDRLFAGRAAGVDYDPLEAAGTFRPTDEPVVEFVLFDRPKKTPKPVSQDAEAAWIAARIRDLVDARTPRLSPAPDGVADEDHVLRYGDMALLFRASTDIPVYERALEARGIPFLTQKSKGYYQSDEMVDLVYVLRVIHNPGDRFALACMATGPAMGATDADLLRWFHRDPEGRDPRSPWERMVAEAEAGGAHADTIRLIQALRVEAAGGALAHAVERALVELGLYEVALMRPGGDRAAANLRKAVQVARQLDTSGRRGLDDLLLHLARMRDRQAGESEAPIGGEADDVVRLTTIHGAKGLEYPVVFVPDLGRQPQTNSDRIQYDGERAIAVRVADPLEGTTCTPGGHEAIQRAERDADAQEALRVLYVAMTRAEERLILSALAEGATKAGQPARCAGWGRQVWDILGIEFLHGTRLVTLPGRPGADPGLVRVQILDATAVATPDPAAVDQAIPPVDDASLAEARAWVEAAAAPVAELGDTRFVVSVSELLTFAASPQQYYEERVVRGGARAAAAAAWDAPRHDLDGPADPGDDAHPERREAWDEVPDDPMDNVPDDILRADITQEDLVTRAPGGPDRAAVGRAVHAALEHVRASDDTVPDALIERAVEAEGGDAAFAAMVRAMANRFLASPMGAQLREGLARGHDVRREVALHARIRFPGGEPVGGFDSLLVKGSIDLWLPTDDGVLVVDHKTNRKGGAFATPADLAEHYAWQLRLYALATERALGTDVAGAYLMLLDPSWGADALAVAVDVGGDALQETRRLCRAFAMAELEGRYPADWRELVAPEPERA